MYGVLRFRKTNPLMFYYSSISVSTPIEQNRYFHKFIITENTFILWVVNITKSIVVFSSHNRKSIQFSTS